MSPSQSFLSIAAALAAAGAGFAGTPEPPQDTETASLIERASEYAVNYFRSLSLVVCEETYEQRLYRPDVSYTAGLTPRGGERVVLSRVLVSDYLLVQLRGTRGWTGFRDVYSVDGSPVRDRTDRLTALFLNPGESGLRQAEQVRAESSRYNIGSAIRDINVPTFVLHFILPEIRERFTFRLKGREEVDRLPTRVVEYEETARPTLITGLNDEPVPARGSFWIDPTSGEVLRTRLDTKSGPKKARIEVSFTRDERIGFLVPNTMTERHTILEETLVGRATYGNYRQFKVETTEQIKNQ